MQLGFVEYQPTPGAAVAASAAAEVFQFGAQLRVCVSVQRRRPGMGVKHAVDDFGDHMLRRIQHILIGCPAR